LLALTLSLCAGCLRVQHGPPAVLPLVHTSTDATRWYAVVDSPDLGRRLFFVDTGYSRTTCDDAFAAELDLKLRGQVPVRGEVGHLSASLAALPAWRLGEHTVRGLRCVVRDLHGTSSVRDPLEVDVAGVLGADLLGRFYVVIDPEAATLTLAAPLKRRLAGHDVVPLRRELGVGARREVRLQVGDARLWGLLDTGTSRSYVDGEALRFEVAYTRPGVQVTGSGGTSRRDVPMYVERVRLGDLDIGELQLSQRDGPGDGLIGLDVLGPLHQEYDLRHGRARFTRAGRGSVPSWRQWQYQADSSAR